MTGHSLTCAVATRRSLEQKIWDRDNSHVRMSQFRVQIWAKRRIATLFAPNCRDFGVSPAPRWISHQGSRYFGGIRNRDNDGRADQARHSALMSEYRCTGRRGIAIRTEIRTECPGIIRGKNHGSKKERIKTKRRKGFVNLF